MSERERAAKVAAVKALEALAEEGDEYNVEGSTEMEPTNVELPGPPAPERMHGQPPFSLPVGPPSPTISSTSDEDYVEPGRSRAPLRMPRSGGRRRRHAPPERTPLSPNRRACLDIVEPFVERMHDEDNDGQEENTRPASRSVRKQARLTGDQYVGSKNKVKPARSVKQCVCDCRCIEKVPQPKRQEIFDAFYAMGTKEQQKQFIANHIQSSATKQKTGKRNFFHRYYFSVDGNREKVCMKFFMMTLDVKESVIRNIRDNKGQHGVVVPRRAPPPARNVLSPQVVAEFRGFMETLPRVPSHYCRASTNKDYLAADLNRSKLYKVYKSRMVEIGQPSAMSERSFNRHLRREYPNLAFYKPKKDQCSKCTAFRHYPPTLQEEHAAEQEAHMRRNKLAQEEKKRDKQAAGDDPKIVSVNFDLQKVLYTPSTEAAPLFYKLKLSNYNFTIFEQVTKRGFAYFWPEFEGKRGSVEIGTCLIDYLRMLDAEGPYDCVSMFSDGCSGQNKNQFVLAALIWAIQNLGFNEIHQKFLETGHTYMECDSMHRVIEQAKTSASVEVYVPRDWINVIRTARKTPGPYILKEMTHDKFIDLKAIAFQIFQRGAVPFQMSKVVHLKVTKNEPNTVYYRADFEADFQSFKVPGSIRGSRSRATGDGGLPKAYNRQLQVPEKKYRDLLYLCDKNIILQECQQFYRSLPNFRGDTEAEVPEFSDREIDANDSDHSDSEDDLPLIQLANAAPGPSGASASA